MTNSNYHLTQREEELMDFFWAEKKPLTSVEILASPQERSWKDNYLQIMLRSLLKKGILRICGTVQYGTQYARQFEPVYTREEYLARTMLDKGIKNTSVLKVMVAMAQEEQNGDKEKLIEQLEEIIEELRGN